MNQDMKQLKKRIERMYWYNQLIEHANIRVGVIQMIEETPKGFEKLKDL